MKFTRIPQIGLVMVLMAALIALGCTGDSDGDAEATPSPTEESTSTSTATTQPATPTETPTATATPFAGEVAEIRIPRFGVASAIEARGLIPGTNQLDTPADPNNTAWYEIYDRPGWGGNAVFSAHVDYYPDIEGPFYQLAEMEGGDEVVIEMADGTEYVYEVFSNKRYETATIPMGDIIWPPDKPEDEEWITLITCGGDFQPYNGYDGPGYYVHRDVVVARRIE